MAKKNAFRKEQFGADVKAIRGGDLERVGHARALAGKHPLRMRTVKKAEATGAKQAFNLQYRKALGEGDMEAYAQAHGLNEKYGLASEDSMMYLAERTSQLKFTNLVHAIEKGNLDIVKEAEKLAENYSPDRSDINDAKKMLQEATHKGTAAKFEKTVQELRSGRLDLTIEARRMGTLSGLSREKLGEIVEGAYKDGTLAYLDKALPQIASGDRQAYMNAEGALHHAFFNPQTPAENKAKIRKAVEQGVHKLFKKGFEELKKGEKASYEVTDIGEIKSAAMRYGLYVDSLLRSYILKEHPGVATYLEMVRRDPTMAEAATQYGVETHKIAPAVMKDLIATAGVPTAKEGYRTDVKAKAKVLAPAKG